MNFNEESSFYASLPFNPRVQGERVKAEVVLMQKRNKNNPFFTNVFNNQRREKIY